MKKAIIYIITILFINQGYSQVVYSLSDSLLHPGAAYRCWPTFVFDLAKMTPENLSSLDNMVQFLKDHPGIVIEISVHTDTRVSSEYSQCLSCKRALYIADYFISQGISKARLIPKGYQDISPLIPEDEINKMGSTEEQENAHRTNRRVEYRIISIDFKEQ